MSFSDESPGRSFSWCIFLGYSRLFLTCTPLTFQELHLPNIPVPQGVNVPGQVAYIKEVRAL